MNKNINECTFDKGLFALVLQSCFCRDMCISIQQRQKRTQKICRVSKILVRIVLREKRRGVFLTKNKGRARTLVEVERFGFVVVVVVGGGGGGGSCCWC